MVLTILAVVAIAALVVTFWRYILEFLNTTVRDFLNKYIGEDKCRWYVDFLLWADEKITASNRVIKDWWHKFKDTVIKVQSRYHKNEDGTYTKQTESIVRVSPTSGKRVVVEETVGWEYLPRTVREEMVRLRTRDAELDDRAVTEEKLRQRATQEGIVLSA